MEEANSLLVEPKTEAAAVKYLKEQGILVRAMRLPLENCFRMGLRGIEEMERFFESFQRYLV